MWKCKLKRDWKENGRRARARGRGLAHLACSRPRLIREWLADFTPAPQLNQNGLGLGLFVPHRHPCSILALVGFFFKSSFSSL